jgi:flavin-dependent dehydrogenase
MFDIAVIGAGPAGATLARLIGKRFRVLLVDRRRIIERPDSFAERKCCGGLLAPDAQKMLSRLGLGLPGSVLEEPQLFVVKAIDVRRGLERYYQRHYINIDRQRFDCWLLSLVPTGVDIRTGCRLKAFSREKGFFRLTFSQGGKTHEEKARILVGADGASSKVRFRALGKRLFPKRYIAIQEWVEGDSNFPYFTSIFDPEITDYYCWTIPKGDHLLVGAALEPGNRAPHKFELLKARLKKLDFAFGKTAWREGAHILRPVNSGQLSTGGKGIALIGEAAGWISPSSAEGLSYAFRSALMLAEALSTSSRGFERRYHERTGRLRRNIFLKNLKSRVIFNPALRKAVMQSGLQTVNVVKHEEDK